MSAARGYAAISCDGRVVHEHDTFTCGHCGMPSPIAPGQVDTDSCRVCESHLCPGCARRLARTLKCIPFERRLEALERSR